MRTFSARETEWLQELDGIELAGFWQRAFAFVIDWAIVGVILTIVVSIAFTIAYAYFHHKGMSDDDMVKMATSSAPVQEIQKAEQEHPGQKVYTYKAEGSKAGEAIKVAVDIGVPVLYFGILLWKGKGRTPGKRLMKIRVMSIVHRHLSFWHCVERALGYGAAALEGGFGFVQFFIHPYRRCAQDRLAETIVVTEASYQQLQHRLSHPLVPDGTPDAPPEDAPAEA